jgi:hypothetical protein
MPEYTTRLNLPKPLGNENVTRLNHIALVDAIELAAAPIASAISYGATSGTNTYTVAPSPALSSYVDGSAVSIKIGTTNTGASTINVNGLGAKNILDSKGNAMTAGKLRATSIYTLRYNGTDFILQGEGGYGNAASSDLLSGKTASTDVGDITGTMPNNGAVNRTPSNVAQSIPAGYTSGGTVSAVVVPAANVLTGTTIAGTAGTMPNNGAVTITPSASNQAITLGYHNGSGVVNGVVVPTANVLTGTTIAGTAGTMPNNGSPTYTPSTVNQNIPAGYISGGTVLGDPDLIAANILNGINIFGIVGTSAPRQFASGTTTSSASPMTFVDDNNTASATNAGLIVSGLTFTPTVIVCNHASQAYVMTVYKSGSPFRGGAGLGDVYRCFVNGTQIYRTVGGTGNQAYVNATGFCLPVYVSNASYNWFAYA